ncbi:MAG: hypothetical protein Q4F40_10320 [Akkermansia sp.]|nr:hypothetical protein [Akkermansia sp.]
MKQKKLKYSRPMTKRERFDRRRRLMEEEEGARRLEESKAAYLETIRQRALSVQNNEEVRALCRDVWSKRHFCSAAISMTDSILKERRAKKELPMP